MKLIIVFFILSFSNKISAIENKPSIRWSYRVNQSLHIDVDGNAVNIKQPPESEFMCFLNESNEKLNIVSRSIACISLEKKETFKTTIFCSNLKPNSVILSLETPKTKLDISLFCSYK